MTQNPYETPRTDSPTISNSTEFEEIRRNYIKHEASVKSVGLLYWLGGVLLLFAALAGLVSSGESGMLASTGFSLFLLVLAILQFWIGRGLRKLKRWSRIPAGIMSGIGLLGFPVGTLVNCYILYLICGKKGSFVFSTSYAEIIQETPHVKYKTSKAIWIILLAFVLLLGGLITFAALQ